MPSEREMEEEYFRQGELEALQKALRERERLDPDAPKEIVVPNKMTEQTATDINETTFPKGCIRELEVDVRELIHFLTRQIFDFIVDKQPVREAQRHLEDVLNSWDRVRLSHAALLARVTELEGKLAAAEKIIRLAHVLSTNANLTLETQKWLKEVTDGD